MRRAWPFILFALITVLPAAEAPTPSPTLPPQPRSLQLETRAPAATKTPEHPAPGDGSLIDDIGALRRSVERVQQSLAESPTTTRPTTAPSRAAEHATATEAERRFSARFGAERLTVLVPLGGEPLVSAAIEREAAEVVYRELALLLGRTLDDTGVVATRRAVSLHLKDVPWAEAFDRLLGQIGLGWHEDGGKGSMLVVFDTALHPRDRDLLEDLAGRALRNAAAKNRNAAGAEALWLMGANEAAARRPLEAMRRFSQLADTYSSDSDPAVQVWVRRAIRGVGEAMMALDQFQDARGVFLNYIARAEPTDPELPDIYLAAAEAARRQGLAKNDALALDGAIDTLQNLLEEFGNHPTAASRVQIARLNLGELLFEAGRWREAGTQLKLVVANAGGKANDLLAFRLAECAFHENHPADALPTYIELSRRWKSGKTDGAADSTLYATAAYRIGQCHLLADPPKHVHALFAFLRARQDFPESNLDAELLISIARCYAELQRDDDTVNALWELLRTDAVADQRPGQLQLDQLLGELEGRLGGYAGAVRAKAMFYIAQADFRRAQRDRRVRTAAAADAVHHYERTIAERPPKDLLHAARLGLARAAILGGQNDLGESTLRELLADPSLSLRDRDYAANLLGSHLRDQGRLREAIKAFNGEVE
ncbi:MAG TPA: STN domain-containing protein [Planctomycetota bacterium]|nr:STN domain-containing protein [Planctomycetota bacterium]